MLVILKQEGVLARVVCAGHFKMEGVLARVMCAGHSVKEGGLARVVCVGNSKTGRSFSKGNVCCSF